MTSNIYLDKALEIAIKAHSGQKDKVGAPYILHPLRIMMKMDTTEERIVAALHDVIEDSDITLEDLREAGFHKSILEAVDGLTRRKGEDYEAYVERASSIPLAKRIKIADLEDNMNFRRLNNLMEKDAARMLRYQKAYRYLTGRNFTLRFINSAQLRQSRMGSLFYQAALFRTPTA